MRHRIKGYQLNRDVKQRRALYKNLITDLIIHGRIQTTQAKANAVRPAIEKLITQAKSGNQHSRRQIDSFINQSKLVTKLINDIAPKFNSRKGGYTKITKLMRRRGDNALLVQLELLDFKPTPTKSPDVSKKTSEVKKVVHHSTTKKATNSSKTIKKLHASE